MVFSAGGSVITGGGICFCPLPMGGCLARRARSQRMEARVDDDAALQRRIAQTRSNFSLSPSPSDSVSSSRFLGRCHGHQRRHHHHTWRHGHYVHWPQYHGALPSWAARVAHCWRRRHRCDKCGSNCVLSLWCAFWCSCGQVMSASFAIASANI